jgi:NAD(P)-dependent dehydrogenase (short-subunit alcohol dehydrogenase family)
MRLTNKIGIITGGSLGIGRAGALRFAKEGAESVGNSPADFNNYVRAEFVKYNKVIKDNGIKAD